MFFQSEDKRGRDVGLRETLVCIRERPRRDINGGSETAAEVTVSLSVVKKKRRAQNIGRRPCHRWCSRKSPRLLVSSAKTMASDATLVGATSDSASIGAFTDDRTQHVMERIVKHTDGSHVSAVMGARLLGPMLPAAVTKQMKW